MMAEIKYVCVYIHTYVYIFRCQTTNVDIKLIRLDHAVFQP